MFNQVRSQRRLKWVWLLASSFLILVWIMSLTVGPIYNAVGGWGPGSGNPALSRDRVWCVALVGGCAEFGWGGLKAGPDNAWFSASTNGYLSGYNSAMRYGLTLPFFHHSSNPTSVFFSIPIWLVLVLLGGVSTLLVWRDRKLRRRLDDGDIPKCRRCGYNLTGNVTGTCSECGAAFET